MSALDPPDWCRWRRGEGAVLLVAPHGGRRDPLPPTRLRGGKSRERKVNDLYTADVAEELADALGAALIVNPALDRNRLDLNRISQVTAQAPWFLALIETLVSDILGRHGRAELLFVHGWNVIQPKCDVGIGHALADAESALGCSDALTVSPSYAAERLSALQSRCASAGITATFGDRYPARHPNNLLQLFRRAAPRPHTPPRLAEWAAAGRIEAVQLELGVPVRWPGQYRRRFLRATVAAFEDAIPPAHAASAPARGRAGSAGARLRDAALPSASAGQPADAVGERPLPGALQLYDPSAGIALTARVDRTGTNAAGRLLIFVGRERLALFLGEDVQRRHAPGDGPHFTPAPNGFRLRFAGAALACDDGGLYWDLEQAFAASHLCSVAVDLSFRRELTDDYGVAEGSVTLDGRRHHVQTHAFARHGVLSGSAAGWSSQLALSAAFGAQRALRIRHEFPGSGALRELTANGEAVAALPPLTIGFDGDRYTPARIVVGDGGLVCEPHTRMAITRPLPPHRHARVTFGAARFTHNGEAGFGFYEYARALV